MAAHKSDATHQVTPADEVIPTNVGLILGGGGITGFAFHTTTLSILQQLTGWDPRSAKVIVGTSAGSNIGGLLRGGVPIHQTLDDLLTMPTNPRSMERMRELSGRETNASLARLVPTSIQLSIREAMRGPWMRPTRLVSGLLPTGATRTDNLGDRMAEFHTKWPKEDLYVTAVRADTGRLVVFGKERTDIPVGTAVEASSAIPGFFRPVWIDGHHYIDGGVASPTNGDLLIDRDLDMIIMVAPMSLESVSAALTVPSGALRVYWRSIVRAEVARLTEAGHTVLLIEPSAEGARAMGSTLMDPTRVINVVLHTTSAARVSMTTERIEPLLHKLQSLALAPAAT